MLAIRMQRTGRKGHAQFRVIVQESRLTPTSGRVVAYLGSYNPHTKVATLEKEKAAFYLEHGAQPSDRIVRLLKQEGVALPKWVQSDVQQQRVTRNPDKLRKNRPVDPAGEAVPSAAAEAQEAEAAAEAADNPAVEPAAIETEDSAPEPKPSESAEAAEKADT